MRLTISASDAEKSAGKPRILFVCAKLGARACIAAAIAKHLAASQVEVFSACFEKGRFGKRVLLLMQEVGLEIPPESPQSIFERFQQRESFDYVITLCGEASPEPCDVFYRVVEPLYGQGATRLQWSVQGFASLAGTEAEWMAKARVIRAQIHREVTAFLSSHGLLPPGRLRPGMPQARTGAS